MATASSLDVCMVTLPNKWVDARAFEGALCAGGQAYGPHIKSVVVEFPEDCKLMIDVAIRLLSLCNHLKACSKDVRLFFSPNGDLRGYLNRMGFFDHLSRDVDVLPFRPFFSGANIHRGSNRALVEIERIDCRMPVDQSLAPRLAETVERACAKRSDAKDVGFASFNIFSELIKNVFEHSHASADAYAALQTYTGGNRLTVTVSDSGIGMMGSLRPTLVGTDMHALSNVDLLVEMFRRGVSSKHEGKRGLGLMSSAKHAIQFRADLDVRLHHQRVLLKPSNDIYSPHMAYSQTDLPLLQGTHVSFSFKLD